MSAIEESHFQLTKTNIHINIQQVHKLSSWWCVSINNYVYLYNSWFQHVNKYRKLFKISSFSCQLFNIYMYGITSGIKYVYGHIYIYIYRYKHLRLESKDPLHWSAVSTSSTSTSNFSSLRSRLTSYSLSRKLHGADALHLWVLIDMLKFSRQQ